MENVSAALHKYAPGNPAAGACARAAYACQFNRGGGAPLTLKGPAWLGRLDGLQVLVPALVPPNYMYISLSLSTCTALPRAA